ncbi:hypothetical protein QRX60_45715 [Amycolatopsis mongoliensis]|uniref:Membrane-associated oxidoreductase n=1 Tax=Amycolatopsis mongoliensis TaxID=715475 RepID=A0A9Y2JNF9_9PSEU|nr:hypothetical protein [Amycolatopsis sp. 4-36]WIY01253.1 hypothetical protein QRX60_45715 [Amycolatopsis sp. 4-36]
MKALLVQPRRRLTSAQRDGACSIRTPLGDSLDVTDYSLLPMLDDLARLERELIDAARAGDTPVGSGLTVEELADDNDPAHEIRARLLREMLLGQRGTLDPKGIKVQGARITGTLDLDNVAACSGLSVTSCVVTSAITARYASLPWLRLAHCRVGNVHADGIRVISGMWLDSLRVTGIGGTGAIRLPGSHIGGMLDLSRTEIINETGPALFAPGLRVDGNIWLRDAQLGGVSERGAIQLFRAQVDGALIVRGAEIMNLVGPAMSADQLRVEAGLNLDKVHVIGGGMHGAIRLIGAQIGGMLSVLESELTNVEGLVLDVENTRVDSKVFLPITVICSEFLTNNSCDRSKRVDINGFRFGALEVMPYRAMPWQEWLHLIRCHTEAYRPGPYQQLAAAERAAGHDGNARRILIAQQRDLYDRAPKALGNWLTRRFHWLWGVLAGYGYLTRRTAAALLITLAVAGGLGLWAGHVTDGGHHIAERTGTFTDPTGRPCTSVELIGLGLDRGLPLAATGVRNRCDLNPDTNLAAKFTVAIWLTQAVIWGLATLALAGYTGLVRRTT